MQGLREVERLTAFSYPAQPYRLTYNYGETPFASGSVPSYGIAGVLTAIGTALGTKAGLTGLTAAGTVGAAALQGRSAKKQAEAAAQAAAIQAQLDAQAKMQKAQYTPYLIAGGIVVTTLMVAALISLPKKKEE
tara:strand:+ start:62 stop:463 length:402 start_codon:yes stop_codon:yes gene_type:complete